LAGSQTLRFDIVGDASSAARAFRSTADGAALAARGSRQLSDALAIQSKTAQVSAAATESLAKSDRTLLEAQALLAVGAREATEKLQAEGRAAEEAAVKTRVAGDAAKGAGGGFGLLASPMGAAIGAGVALAPVLVTVGVGMAGLGAAAAKTVAPILQAGTATKEQQQALASLDPAQRAAYNSLSSLKTEFGGFAKSLEPETLGLFNRGLGIASTLLKGTAPVAAATGKALDTVLGRVDAEFQSQKWQNFFGFMAKTAGPDVQQLGNLIIDLTGALPPLLEDLQPLATGLIQVADGAARTVNALANLPSDLNRAQAATNDYLSGLEKHIPAGNKNIFQVLGDGLGWLEKHIPAGNKSLLDLASRSDSAAASVKKTGDNAGKAGDSIAQAAPKVGTLAGDVALLGTSTTNAATALSAYSDAWNKILGNSLSDQQAILADESAFSSLATAVKNSGGQSLQARQSFVSYMQQIGTSISTLQQNGASVKDINAEYQVNIARLQALHNLTPSQRADVQGLIKDYDTWATSTAGLNGKTLTAAQTIKNQFTAALAGTGQIAPQVTADVNGFTASVLKTGTSSQATQQYRAQLIADLRQAGIDGKTAAALVNGLQKQIDALHGKTVPVGVTASGSGGVSVSATGLAARIFKLEHLAAGGFVSGGTAGKDSVPALLMPGEVVVPTAMVAGGAVDHLRGKLPGFAAGGQVPQLSDWTASQAGDIIGSWAGSSVQSMLNSMVSQYLASAVPTVATAGSAGGIIATMMRNMAAARGWTGAQWNALYALENREAGFSMTARNPSSGAYGLAQFIQGPSEYAQYGGNATTAQGQITGMLNYIAQRYGNPANAWAHEVNYGWYDRGGMLGPGLTLAYNGTGSPEQVIPAGRGSGSGDVHVHLHNEGVIGSRQELQRWLLESTRELARTRGGGDVQRAFGRQ
jgi:hypothetical protein